MGNTMSRFAGVLRTGTKVQNDPLSLLVATNRMTIEDSLCFGESVFVGPCARARARSTTNEAGFTKWTDRKFATIVPTREVPRDKICLGCMMRVHKHHPTDAMYKHTIDFV